MKIRVSDETAVGLGCIVLVVESAIIFYLLRFVINWMINK